MECPKQKHIVQKFPISEVLRKLYTYTKLSNFPFKFRGYNLGSSELKLQNTSFSRNFLETFGSRCFILQQAEDPGCPDGVTSIT